MKSHYVLDGKPSTSILELTFDVDDITAQSAQNWAKRFEALSITDEVVCFELHCLPSAAYHADVESHGETFGAASSLPKNSWPNSGNTLWASLNDDEPKFAMHRVLAPPANASCEDPIDVSAHIKPGANKLRVVHFGDCSDRVFVLRSFEPDFTMKEACVNHHHTLSWTRIGEDLQKFSFFFPGLPFGNGMPVK